MTDTRTNLLQGTLDLLILKSLALGELHGLGVARRVEQITRGTFHVPAGDTRTHYDVIDRRGVVVAKVDVPNGGHIVGFGAQSIYVVRQDADDLQYLQRFALP